MNVGGYEILGELGRGGMGVVYRVRTPREGEAALKLLPKADAATLARFERERRLLASLGEKEGFVGLLDAGVSGETPWLVMPLVPGGTLRKRLQAGPLGVSETVALGQELARSLGEAHARGIVHRDVKPENILFTEKGRPLIADLGLAKHFTRLVPGASQSLALTTQGAFKGTPGYSAPEQLGDTGGVGPPADVFALGAVLYECLAGRPAFPGETVLDQLAKLSSGAVEPIGRAAVPARLEAVLRRALAHEPSDRFADGFALARALEGDARDDGPGPRRVARLVVPGVVGAALLAAVLLARGRSPGKPEADRPSLSARDLVAIAAKKLDQGDPDGTVADASKAIELDSRLAPAWLARGAARCTKHALDAGIADLSKAIELDPGLALAWAHRATAHFEKGALDAAIADSSRALELDPHLARAWATRGAALASKSQLDAAIADLSKALELDPGAAPTWGNRGLALFKKGLLDESIADSTRAIELDPGCVLAWTNRGAALLGKGQLDAAVVDTTRAIELDPKYALAWANRGAALVARGQLDAGIADLSRAIELDPGIATAWQSRGAAHGQRGELDAAIADLSRAVELEPGLTVAWTNRGIARGQKGDFPGAIADYEHALELVPSGPDAERIRGRLAEARQHVR